MTAIQRFALHGTIMNPHSSGPYVRHEDHLAAMQGRCLAKIEEPAQAAPAAVVGPAWGALRALSARWLVRAADALPVDAMLINKHIRELSEVLAAQPRETAHDSEIAGLEASCATLGRLVDELRPDGERLEWLLRRLSDSALRAYIGIAGDTGDMAALRTLIDAHRGTASTPAPALEAPAAPSQGFIPGQPGESVESAWLLVRSLVGDGEGGSDETDTSVLALRGENEQWFVAGDWRANSTFDSVHDDGGRIIGWMPYEVPEARLAAAPQAPAPNLADAYMGAREDVSIWKRRALEAERDLRAEREANARLVAEVNAANGPTHIGEAAPQAPAAPSAWLGPVRELLGHLSDVLDDEAFGKIDTTRWNAVSSLIGTAPASPWKDHQTARLVNDLRDCAIKYHPAGQLRERIAHIVAPLCDQLKAAQAAPAAPAVDASGAVPVVLGKKLFQFSCHQDWVNRAQRAWKMAGVNSDRTICLDQKGRVLRKGLEFARADKEGAFPVDVYLALVDDTEAHDAWLAAQAKEGDEAC